VAVKVQALDDIPTNQFAVSHEERPADSVLAKQTGENFPASRSQVYIVEISECGTQNNQDTLMEGFRVGENASIAWRACNAWSSPVDGEINANRAEMLRNFARARPSFAHSEKATNWSPDGVCWRLPPPQEITTYCLFPDA